MKRYNLVITGFGSVGWHVADLLAMRVERYRNIYQTDVRVVAVCGSQGGLYNPDGVDWSLLQSLDKERGGLQATSQASPYNTGAGFITRIDADILIEAGPNDVVTGGPGYDYIRTALCKGMHTVVISKGALVKDYPGLAKLAKANRAMLKISGATAASLPTIDLIQYNLAGCQVANMTGIFTGTTNFVLSAMQEDGISFEAAVAEAQRRGIAEPDPSHDLDGWDTACKLTILANAAFGGELSLHDVKRDGIRSVTSEQMVEWHGRGVVPKLVGEIKHLEGKVSAEVKVALYSFEHPFAQVKGATKAVNIETDVMGDLLVVGGKSDPRAAAAAALKDVEHILQNEQK